MAANLPVLRLILGAPLFVLGLYGLLQGFPLAGLVALLAALYLSLRPETITARLRISYWEGLGVLLVLLAIMVFRALR